MPQWHFMLLTLLAISNAHGLKLDDIADLHTQRTSHLEQFILLSIKWMKERASINDYPPLGQYADQLQQVLKPACMHCIDYFEAVAHLRALGTSVTKFLTDDKLGLHWPVVRRSYVAAVWLLQRSTMFSWKATHMGSSTANTMYRQALASRSYQALAFTTTLLVKTVTSSSIAQGLFVFSSTLLYCLYDDSWRRLRQTRTALSLLQTVCEACTKNARLDSPLWMVSHIVNNSGVFPDRVNGVLDAHPESAIARGYNRHEFATEPPLDMWLMYACPYQLNGRVYGCAGRQAAVEMTGTTFMANERALSHESGQPQVCPNFVNAIILREPVPQVISLLAEVRFRYERQLAVKNITSWQPPAWNLTWWETLGPALVGNYATRSLIGRHSFCRSASNMNNTDLSQAVHSLLSFDMVMTLRRAKDIDLLVSTMLSWTARNFSTQPATRVRDTVVIPKTINIFGTRSLLAVQADSFSTNSSYRLDDQFAEPGPLTMAVETIGLQDWTLAGASTSRSLSEARQSSDSVVMTAGEVWPAAPSFDDRLDRHEHISLQATNIDVGTHVMNTAPDEPGTEDSEEFDGDAYDAVMDEDEGAGFGRSAPAPMPPEAIDVQNAIRLVQRSHLQRQAQQEGISSTSAASQALRQLKVTYLGQVSKHGAYLVETSLNQSRELWHAFPRHNITLTSSDTARLESLTKYDAQLFELANTMFNLDVAWLRHMLQHQQYKKKVAALADTYAACGFAGMLPRKNVKHRPFS